MIDLWSWTALASFGLGALSGVLSSVAGVGGAVVTTPGIRAMGGSPLTAVGSTVPAIIPGAITGTYRYAKLGLVDTRVGVTCGGFGAVSALAGVWVSDQVNGNLLMVITAMLVIWSSYSALRGARPARESGDGISASNASVPMLAAVGAGAGFVAGLLGVGGGIILVPSFTTFLRMPVKRTVATSLVAVAMMSVSSLIGHWASGHIDWSFALPMSFGVIPGARLGSHFAAEASEATMKRVVGLLLGAMGVIYLVTELLQL